LPLRWSHITDLRAPLELCCCLKIGHPHGPTRLVMPLCTAIFDSTGCIKRA
jgi:hypothetical protein